MGRSRGATRRREALWMHRNFERWDIRQQIMYIESKGGGHVEQWGLRVPSGGSLTVQADWAHHFLQDRQNDLLRWKTFHRWNGIKRITFAKRLVRAIGSQARKRRGGDSLYTTNIVTEIDEDVREEYWTEIRNKPELKHQTHT